MFLDAKSHYLSRSQPNLFLYLIELTIDAEETILHPFWHLLIFKRRLLMFLKKIHAAK